MARQLVVVDVESTGLIPGFHVPLEVAAVNLDTGEELSFVPWVHPSHMAKADPVALQINRYYERGVFKDRLTLQQTFDRYRQLFDMLEGNTFGGANPRFDAEMVRVGYSISVSVTPKPYDRLSLPDETWQHRLQDVQAYAAGVLGFDPADPPSLVDLLEALGIDNREPHSALWDARATAEAFKRLKAKRDNMYEKDVPY
ncbi:DnaQ-like exonuclease [Mycobacterium phage Typha]|uniref:DnaQ-like exonuclease n=1 Tax=Mycobacterium phage Typha TaxID=2517971 RepID=A0A482JCL0_9CAUD|nr:DnaQ-like exonuclease [Mycobacterium phage Typha]QBP29711.1 DnaQ-like exonuclease [Mycobacterium phage Typha]URM86498.1 DnaQ-like DNA polymerase III subunit [Mycobacterium phage Hilltopfarm]